MIVSASNPACEHARMRCDYTGNLQMMAAVDIMQGLG